MGTYKRRGRGATAKSSASGRPSKASPKKRAASPAPKKAAAKKTTAGARESKRAAARESSLARLAKVAAAVSASVRAAREHRDAVRADVERARGDVAQARAAYDDARARIGVTTKSLRTTEQRVEEAAAAAARGDKALRRARTAAREAGEASAAAKDALEAARSSARRATAAERRISEARTAASASVRTAARAASTSASAARTARRATTAARKGAKRAVASWQKRRKSPAATKRRKRSAAEVARLNAEQRAARGEPDKSPARQQIEEHREEIEERRRERAVRTDDLPAETPTEARTSLNEDWERLRRRFPQLLNHAERTDQLSRTGGLPRRMDSDTTVGERRIVVFNRILNPESVETIIYRVERAARGLPGAYRLWLAGFDFAALSEQIEGSDPALLVMNDPDAQFFQTRGRDSTGITSSREGMLERIRSWLEEKAYQPRSVIYLQQVKIMNYDRRGWSGGGRGR